MKSYYRLMLGKKSSHAAECFEGGFVGVDFDLAEDLSEKLPDSFREFNRQFIPTLQAQNPDQKKISAGLACGMIWTVSKGMRTGDMVLCPDGKGTFHVGEVFGDYY